MLKTRLYEASFYFCYHYPINICVLCSARDLDDKYVMPAKELAKLLAENGHNPLLVSMIGLAKGILVHLPARLHISI